MKKDRLPEEYLKEMRDLLGPEYDAYLDSLEERPCSGLRVNTRKTSPEQIAAHFGLTEQVPWTDNGFYITEESRFTKHPYYLAGLYYIQEPSAMISAASLGTLPGERVLDLCAAPGGKTTQIGADLQGRGILIANDLSASRAKALLKNIELMGIPNTYVTAEDSGRLKQEFPLWFDRILIDAPCSGEGMFRKRPSVLQGWLEHGRDFYCPVQAKLLDDAAEMLRPGGTLLYSTCTFNRHENEDQIRAFLSRHPEFSLDPGAPKAGCSDSAILPGTRRIFPQRSRGEGHFAARMRKAGGEECVALRDSFSDRTASGGTGSEQAMSFRGVPAEAGAVRRSGSRKNASGDFSGLETFFEKCSWKPDPARTILQGENVLLLPEELAGKSIPLRCLRTGLLLGQLKNGRFRPSQALAMALTKESWSDPVDLPSDSDAVRRYLKGETIEAPDSGSGYRLFCTDGFPLGFVKQDRGRLKNMMLPAWRMQ